MKKQTSKGAGSLDMLLDTMCNTFGGVCFIALMVAIITASLPKSRDDEPKEETVTEQMVVDKEAARLSRERDELKSAIEIQRSFVATNTVNDRRALSEVQLTCGISSNATELAKLERERLELEDKLAKLTTETSYSNREAMRLERLLKDLNEKLGKAAIGKNRAVRTPVERELSGYRSLDVWIRKGRLYCLKDPRHVECFESDGWSGKSWDYHVRPSSGFLLDDDFLETTEYRLLLERMTPTTFLRIYSDMDSFAQLCRLRDDLIRHRKMYNWYVAEGEVLHFVEGYDGKVQ